MLVAVAIGMGALISVQSRVSAALADETDVYNAGWVTAMTGAVILAVILLVAPRTRRGFGRLRAGLRARTLPWWALLGGLGGMFFVVAQGTAASVLGLALFSMAVVAGQVVGGLVFDSLGAAGGGRRRPTTLRVLGSVLAIAAVSWGALGGGEGDLDVLLLVLAFAAGVGLAGAAGLTGRVQAASRSVVTTAMTNHLLGLTVIVLIVLALLPTGSSGFRLPSSPWLYLGASSARSASRSARSSSVRSGCCSWGSGWSRGS
ncbi:hypothetical protein GCM10025866_13210 [Naasia aerilata]|uniref:Transporter family-2 protein n=1 Tax=Naasia aerilata TaxID=1162966 RepID=A0ABN6XKD9_9MICO|nr:hypothetical protein GCM10025866_13210 [Naasia aerilata]